MRPAFIQLKISTFLESASLADPFQRTAQDLMTAKSILQTTIHPNFRISPKPPTFNPTTGRRLKHYEYMTGEAVKEAISKCHQAFKKWKAISPEDRAEAIKAIGKELIKAKDNEGAMRIANDSRFGLGGGIFSKDEAAAIEMAEQHFDTGMVFINSFGLADPAMPFGGVKDSGYGREHGGFGLKEFVNIKSVMKR